MDGMKRFVVIAAVVAAGVVIWFVAKPPGLRFRMKSRVLEETRTLLFDLPPDYQASGHSYPVLYVLDAYDRSTVFGPSFFLLADQIREMAKEGIPPMILVGVMNTHRARDMIPVESEWEPGSGQADRFLRFFDRELIPRIEEKFRASEERLIYGRSDSALFTLYAFLERTELFSAYIASSPTIGFCPEWITAATERLILRQPPAKTRLFLISGDDDIPLVRDFLPDAAARLRRLPADHFLFEARTMAKGGHVPESSLYLGLRFVYPGRGR